MKWMDWKHPDYATIINDRAARLEYIRQHPEELEDLKSIYRERPENFIIDWGYTFEPRNADVDLPTTIPFILFPKQIDFVRYVMDRWKSRKPGLCEKSRDCGISWLIVALGCTLCLFNRGLVIGYGSRKELYVDKNGEPKSLFWKARFFLEKLPVEFLGDWWAARDAPRMRINFPTGSHMTGEAGDQIGRGDRATIYLVDESAYLERPDQVEHSLSQTTNCRIDVSSVNGMNNPFAKKRHEGKIEPFIFDWKDDPRKDQQWYDKQVSELDPVTVAQEIDRDYSASVHGIVIPGAWVRASLDAFEKLGIKPSGKKTLAFDVADEGLDKNAFVGATGNEIDFLREFSGKGSDIFATVSEAFAVCDQEGYSGCRYDADGLGASVRGDARAINDQRRAVRPNPAPTYQFDGFQGSAGVYEPEGIVEGTIGTEGDRGRQNQDYFQNRKAQGWWNLRNMFRKTYRWVVEGYPCNPDEMISISTRAPGSKALVHKLVTELSQPTYTTKPNGKMVINKKPDGMKSPNLGDGVMIKFAKTESNTWVGQITPEMIRIMQAAGTASRRRR